MCWVLRVSPGDKLAQRSGMAHGAQFSTRVQGLTDMASAPAQGARDPYAKSTSGGSLVLVQCCSHVTEVLWPPLHCDAGHPGQPKLVGVLQKQHVCMHHDTRAVGQAGWLLVLRLSHLKLTLLGAVWVHTEGWALVIDVTSGVEQLPAYSCCSGPGSNVVVDGWLPFLVEMHW